jgi:hypothetical protein
VVVSWLFLRRKTTGYIENSIGSRKLERPDNRADQTSIQHRISISFLNVIHDNTKQE